LEQNQFRKLLILQDMKLQIFCVVWDCPGYNDNRGLTQDIANSFYIKNLFEKASSAKIIVVTDFNDIDHDDVT